jgi:hypothetical protein
MRRIQVLTIVANGRYWNIQAVMAEGDIVNDGSNSTLWQNAAVLCRRRILGPNPTARQIIGLHAILYLFPLH